MPKIYRGMKQDQGKPALGPSATTLGARVPDDIDADTNGFVHPRTGGMSVSPSLRTLPAHRVPQRLRALFPAATGRDNIYVWSMGTGDFVDAAVTELLQLRLAPPGSTHGLVEPVRGMSLSEYQDALSATQNFWMIDEK